MIISGCLVKQAESHVIILFLLLWFLLLGSSSGSSLGGGSGSSTTGGGSSSDSRSNLGDQLLEVTALKGLGEEARPVGFELDSSSLEDGGDLLGCDGDVIVGENEGGVDAGEFSGHGDGAQVSRYGLSSTRTRHKISLVEVNQAIL